MAHLVADPLPGPEYAYLLGLYLGDGYIVRVRRGYWLRVSCDPKYPRIIEDCCRAISAVLPDNAVGVIARIDGVYDVAVWSKHLPELFPQHGQGMKHTRPIALEPWQRRIVEAYPRRFIKGLFDSDGSYFLNPVKSPAGDRYLYERYMFTNVSTDIRELWVWACSLIGVESRQSNAKNISVARRDSVAILNEFLGPKR